MHLFPRLRILMLVPLLALLARAALADDYPFELKLSHSGFGEKVLRGTLKGDSFDEFITSGNMRVHLSGSISGDQVRLSGDLTVPGNWGFKPFSTEGAFTNSGTFVGPIVIYPIIGRTARGSITITRPAGAVAEAPPAAAPEPAEEPVMPAVQAAPSAPEPPAPEPAEQATAEPPPPPQTAVVPPEPEEPPLSRNQRMAVQEQLAVLGLYNSGVDGDFGPGTRKAIKKYQRAHGFEPTGYVTEPMLTKLAKQAEARAAEVAAEQQAAEQKAAEQRAAEEKAAQERAAQEAAAAQAKAAQEAAAAAAPPPEPAAPAPPTEQAATEQPPPEQPATPPAEQSADPFAAVIAGLEPIDESFVAVKPAKIRREPSVAADLIETLAAGDRIDVLGRIPHEDWYLVARDGKPLGYVVVGQLAAADTRTTTAESAAATPAPEETAAAPAIPPELAALDFGHYYALVIGNNAYKTLPKLHTAVIDAKAVAASLERDYGFTVALLTDATEEAVIGALADLRRKLKPEDNLLVYYAGHGWYDEEAQRGYWLPVDAAADNPSHWVSNADITDSLKTIKAKHVLVVADSCYSGSLTRGLAIATKGSAYFESVVNRRARTVLTSGGLEPVLDSGGGEHSIFAKAFLDALDANTGIIDGEGVYQRVREQVVLNAEQTPEYGNIRLAGHDGGDFLFVKKQ